MESVHHLNKTLFFKRMVTITSGLRSGKSVLKN